jgi:spermidine synthase
MAQTEYTPNFYGGIFFLTSGALLFEIALIRLFSVAQWYHFAFLVVSIAMLGLGAAGSFLAVFPDWCKRASSQRLANLAWLFAAAVVAAYAISNRIPFDQQRVSWEAYQFLYLLGYYCVLAIPMFLVGLLLSSVYARHSQIVGKLYFFDLCGAAVGSVTVLAVCSLAHGLGGIWTAAACGLISSFLFAPGLKRGIASLAGIGFIGILWLLAPSFFSLRMSEYKALPQLLLPPEAKIVHTEWTPTARIDFVQSALVHFAPGLSLRRYIELPSQLGVVIDGGNLNAITHFNGDVKSLTFVEDLPAALPFHLSKISSQLVFEPLGGLDFLIALHYGVAKIEGAGIYERIAGITREDFDQFSGGLFRDFGIKIEAISPRAYVKKTSQAYDLICLPISDSFGAAGTGIYGPAEDYLYTVESFTECLRHLSADGWLYISCYLLPPLRQELRIISLAVSALAARGSKDPPAHLIAIRTLETFLLLIKSSPVNNPEIDSLRTFCEARGFDLVYYPGIVASELNRFNRFPRPIVHEAMMAILQDSTRKKFYQNYLFDVRPAYDDRPFFGHFFRFDKLNEEYESLGRRWAAFLEGGYLVTAAFLQACGVSIVFIVLPLLWRRRQHFHLPPKKSRVALLAYFFSIGMAYMLIEIVLIQRFILFLDHPLYAASAVIGSLLVSSACGSYVSTKLELKAAWKIGRHLLCLVLVLALYALFLPRMLAAGIGHPLITRAVIAIALNSVLGFLMGFPFPVGIRKLGQSFASLVPWAYCANSSAAVISSAFAVLIALEFGFTWVMMIAIGFYLVAAASSWRWRLS